MAPGGQSLRVAHAANGVTTYRLPSLVLWKENTFGLHIVIPGMLFTPNLAKGEDAKWFLLT